MTIYRGGVGQWSWVLHRLTGVGVLIFLCLHILDTSLIVLGPEHYNAILTVYRMPVFRVMEVGLFLAVLYHTLNGVRITLMDFWVDLTRFHQTLFTVQMGLLIIVTVPVTWVMLRPVFFP